MGCPASIYQQASSWGGQNFPKPFLIGHPLAPILAVMGQRIHLTLATNYIKTTRASQGRESKQHQTLKNDAIAYISKGCRDS